MLTPSAEILEQVRQLEELEARYPVPTLADVMAEWKWVRDLMRDGDFEHYDQYSGRWIAVYNQQIVGADYDPLELQITKSRELGVHPERLVLTYVNEV